MPVRIVYIDVYAASAPRQSTFVSVFESNRSVELRCITSQTFHDWNGLSQSQRKQFITDMHKRVIGAEGADHLGIFHHSDTAKYDGQELGDNNLDEVSKAVVEIFRAVRPKCRKVIYYTGGTPGGEGWIQRAIGTPEQVLSKDEVQDLINWVAADFRIETKPEFLLSRTVEVLAALAILCHGFLAVWAGDPGRRQAGRAWIDRIDGTREEGDLGTVASLLDSLAPAAGIGSTVLANKWDDVRDGSWWRDCFGTTTVKPFVEKELKGPLDEKPKLEALIDWIDGGAAAPNGFEELVAEAYLQIREELKSDGR